MIDWDADRPAVKIFCNRAETCLISYFLIVRLKINRNIKHLDTKALFPQSCEDGDSFVYKMFF